MTYSHITSSTTLTQLQHKLDTIANNIANTETAGYKRRSVTFADVLSSEYLNQPNEEGRLTPHGLRVGTGARASATQLGLEQGPLKETNRELDFALTEADLFFQVQTNEGMKLTRDGSFYWSTTPGDEGLMQLVTKNGEQVLAANGEPVAVSTDTSSLSLSSDGTLLATLADGTVENAGAFALSRVLKPQLLESAGQNLYTVPDGDEVIEGAAAIDAGIEQRKLEGANVDLGAEMTELIATQRQYQFQARAFSLADDMAGLVNGIRR
ncbi:flagellar hook-basal body protein [Shouchella shacheensis]|uniref:flagellar hook-basal body protein n=1 Tax=Shouchella shacheensis TaxID=1649580 RepID=UPI00073FD4C5|nr:flagellar hook-basal body protein [Shouchella shacheensis]